MKNKENHYVQSVFGALKPVLGGLILAAAFMLVDSETFCDFGLGEYNFSVMIFVVSFVALFFFKINPMAVIGVSGLLGVVLF